MVRALAAVRSAIARAVLGEGDDSTVTLGTITLRAHQRDALRRLRESVDQFGGALLADEPGLGKTYVALALARDYPHAIVVAPAALRLMWAEAANAAGETIAFVSLETLSYHEFEVAARGGLVIVDEAHHVCNPKAARYSRLARLVSYRHVLLLSATPVRNRRAELGALLALFMGPRAHSIDDTERSLCIVRRAGDASLLPAIDGPHWQAVESVFGLTGMLGNLPPPLPALDGRAASALLRMTLARCWASSLAALDTALRRRLQRGAALDALLDENRVPTRDELRAWVVGDDAVQLAFPLLVSHETRQAPELRAVLHAHLATVRKIRAHVSPHIQADLQTRAQKLLDLRAASTGSCLIAFTAHAATAEALYRAMSNESGIALLTSRSARTASGLRPRSDIISALAASRPRSPAKPHSRRDDFSLILTTDLLSEGVNLQAANIIVHLDIPWTPAGLDQRVGRAARMGSPHSIVHVHGFAPPAGAERLLKLERRLARKHAERLDGTRAPETMEHLRALVADWRNASETGETAPLVATVYARRTGLIAVVEDRGALVAVGGVPFGFVHWKISDAPHSLLELARDIQNGAAPADAELESRARHALARWLNNRLAQAATGTGDFSSRQRRALLSRVDAIVGRARSHLRAATAERAVRLRSLIENAAGAGFEQSFADLWRAEPDDTDAWLARCERVLMGGASRRAPRSGAPSAVRALLFLRQREVTSNSPRAP